MRQHRKMKALPERRMRHSLKSDLLSSTYQELQQCRDFVKMPIGIARNTILWMLCFGAIGGLTVLAQDTKFVLDRDGRTIVLEPYASNIVRVTLSKDKATAAGAPGYGLVGTPSMTGWVHQRDSCRSRVCRTLCRSTI